MSVLIKSSAKVLPVLRQTIGLRNSPLGKIRFLPLYDIGNEKTPSGELYGAKLHGERAERAQNKSIGKGKENKSDYYYFSD